MSRRSARTGLRWLCALILSLAVPLGATAQGSSDGSSVPTVGPPAGTIVAAGGGALGPEIWERFVSLAGGAQARIVVIPTAADDNEFPDGWEGLEHLEEAGAVDLVVLHTRDRAQADSEEFVAPLRDATGVWMPGGRQHRLAESYLYTQVHEALEEVLSRGGVVGGTSAGASILASVLVRGDPASNQIVMSTEFREGFAFLDQTAVDQHLLARNRERDLWEILAFEPEILGIGLDEGTALIVQGNRAEVIGASQVLIYDASAPPWIPLRLRPGDVFNLGTRSPVPAEASAGEVHGVSSPSP